MRPSRNAVRAARIEEFGDIDLDGEFAVREFLILC